jgi:hypothetical protein
VFIARDGDASFAALRSGGRLAPFGIGNSIEKGFKKFIGSVYHIRRGYRVMILIWKIR